MRWLLLPHQSALLFRWPNKVYFLFDVISTICTVRTSKRTVAGTPLASLPTFRTKCFSQRSVAGLCTTKTPVVKQDYKQQNPERFVEKKRVEAMMVKIRGRSVHY
jgi:hypothetical protein